jgi:uncharacterized NAD-dependent epimerase/dehydratase family protein
VLTPDHRIALYMKGALGEDIGKMGYGVLRYSPNQVVAVVDPNHAGKRVNDVVPPVYGVQNPPVVATLAGAIALGANSLILGIAPLGGLIPENWWPVIGEALNHDMLVVNGLHEQLCRRFPEHSHRIWDIRVEPAGLKSGTGAAAQLPNKRVLFIGTDMATGKMTAGLEVWRLARERGIRAGFVATGQIGITVTGSGVPLDAVRIDYASGAIEREVLKHADAELILVEGQGSLVHPGSSATLPLMRGSCPTHLVMCAIAGRRTVRRYDHLRIPPLGDLIQLAEAVASACGTYPRPKTVAIAMNGSKVSPDEAERERQRFADESGLPVFDPVQDGAAGLLDALLDTAERDALGEVALRE